MKKIKEFELFHDLGELAYNHDAKSVAESLIKKGIDIPVEKLTLKIQKLENIFKKKRSEGIHWFANLPQNERHRLGEKYFGRKFCVQDTDQMYYISQQERKS